MKRRLVWPVIALNLLALVVLAFVYPAPMVSPGPVVPAHAAIASDCLACHAPFVGAAPARCAKCHALGDIGVRSTTGAALAEHPVRPAFHQELTEQDCTACHTDHIGATLGKRSRKPFSHELVRAVTRERCATCHAAPTSGAHPQVNGQCQQCHTTEKWKPASFEHGQFFALDGDHAVACATCHTNNNYKQYTCYGCHEHTPDNVRKEHEEVGTRDLNNCASCHKGSGGEREHGERGGRGEGRENEH
jgi:hypothetical protein